MGNGWLRMTDLQGNEATYARLTTPIPSANNNVTVSLDLAMWNRGGIGAADGMTISLRDASVPFAAGAYGGSLGYANRSGVDGMAGGYFSLGIDNYGNFSNPTEGRNGGTGFVPNAIATRGAGSGQTGYSYLGGTAAPGQLDFPTYTSRPDQSGVDYRQLVFNLDSSSLLTVSLKLGASGTLTQIYTANLSGSVRPENLELVYTGSTGGGQQINEIRSLVVNTTAAPVGNVYYSNYGNDNKWGTGANWGDSTRPNLGLVPGPTANIIFSNNVFTNPAFQLTTAQNIDLQQNRQAASIQFDASFNYTLQGYQLTLDNGAGPTAITVTSAQPGGAHTIQSNLQLNSDLNINTNTGTALVVAGNVNAGTKLFTLNNLGTTTFAGQITGSGNMTQTASGTVVISGNSAATYTGNFDIQKGMLQLGGSNVLNANTIISLSSPTGAGTFNLASNNQTIGALNFNSGGNVTTGSGILTLGGNVTSLASATSALIVGNLNLGSANRTFNVAQGTADPDMTVTANISGTNAGIVKTGAGTLLLSGNNSHTGSNTISAGTLIAAHDNALGTAGVATATSVANAATLGLQGGISIGALETFTVVGAGDTGRNGAIDNLSGNNSLAGTVSLGGNTTIGAATGTTLTLSGVVSQSAASALIANGAGTIVLGATNTYTGATTVNAGTTLVAAANGALGTTAAGTTVTSTGTLGFQGGIAYAQTEALTVSGTGAAGRNGAIDNLSGNNSFAGTIALGAASTIGAATGTQLTLTGIISGAQNLTIAGAGTIVLDGVAANTYSGTTTIGSGATVIVDKNDALGTANATSVASGATLGFQGGTTYATAEALTVAGSGAVGRSGAIENISGTNSFAGTIALSGATTVSTAASSQLTLSGIISGANDLTKTGPGTLVSTAANTYSGVTSINNGTMTLSGTNGAIASSTAINVSDATLVLNNSSLGNANRIGNAVAVTLSDGTFTFIGLTGANSTESIGDLTLAAGNNVLNIATGASNRRADLTVNDIVRNGASTLTINSFSDAAMTTRSTLGTGSQGSGRVLLVADDFNNNNSGLTLAGASNGSPIALPGWVTTVTAAGSTEFTEYSGDTNGIRPITVTIGGVGININDASKVVQLSAADNATPDRWTLRNNGPTEGPTGALGGKVTVDGNLKLLDITTVTLNTDAANRLVLMNGGLLKSGATSTDFTGAGALTSGNGFLAVTVDDVAGTLNLTAPIVNNATAYGTTGALGLNKSGAGLLILGGTNTYTGNNFINAGTLRISSEANLGAAGNDVTFSGGTLNVTGSFTASAAKVFSVSANQQGTIDVNDLVTLTSASANNGVITGDANSVLTKAGLGTFVMAGANDEFEGTLNIGAGTVQLRNANSLGDAANRGQVTLAGGNLELRNNAATLFGNNVTVTANSTINVDSVSAGTNLTHALGNLAIGTNTLTISGGNGFDLAFGTAALTGAATINTAVDGTDVRFAAVSGTGSLTKAGAGLLELVGVNTYAGATNIDAGTLKIGNSAATLPAATALTIASLATFDLNSFSQSVASLSGAGNVTMSAGLTVGSNNASTTFSGVISGAGGLTKTGTGTLSLFGQNLFTGALALNQGTIAYTASDVLANTVAVTIAAPATLNLAGNSDTIGSLAGAGAVQLGSGTLTAGSNNSSTTFSGNISGTGNLVKEGTGTMTLSSTNNHAGTTAVNGGVLAISSSSALGSGDGTLGTGTSVASGATLRISNAISIANESLTLTGGGFGGNGALQNVSGNNFLGGPVTLAGAASIVVNAGNLSLAGTIANAGNTLTVGGTGNTIAGGAITGAGGLTKSGAGALVLNNTGNNFSGATALDAGSIQIGVDNAGPTGSAFTIASGATLDVNNKVATVASLAGTSGSNVVLGTGSLSTGANNSSTSFGGVISGLNGSFTKDGTGTLTFSGANSFTGATTVNAGTLAASANNVLSNQTAVTVAAGATFDLANTTQAVGSIAGAGAVTLGSGQFVAGVNDTSTTYSGVMSGTGTFSKDGTGNLTLTGANSYSGTTTIANGTLTLGASNVLSDSTTVTISSSGTLALSAGITDTIAGLTTTGASTINLAASSALTINSAAPSTLMGNLLGTGTLAYIGGGNLTLANNLSFAGGTLAFGGSTIGLTPTSTLFLGNTTVGTLRITGDTILDFGNSSASVVSTTNFQIDPGVKITINNWIEWQDYFFATNWTGAVLNTQGLGSQTQVTFTGWNMGGTAWKDRGGGFHEITPTPEPATYGLMFMSAALGALGFRRWRASRKSKTATPA